MVSRGRSAAAGGFKPGPPSPDTSRPSHALFARLFVLAKASECALQPLASPEGPSQPGHHPPGGGRRILPCWWALLEGLVRDGRLPGSREKRRRGVVGKGAMPAAHLCQRDHPRCALRVWRPPDHACLRALGSWGRCICGSVGHMSQNQP